MFVVIDDSVDKYTLYEQREKKEGYTSDKKKKEKQKMKMNREG